MSGNYPSHNKDYMHISINLKAFFFVEELDIECSDGVTRKGIFIPYEVNGIYLGEETAYANFSAFATTDAYKMKFKNPNTHVILPRYSKQHLRRLENLGYQLDGRFMGFIRKYLKVK